MCKEKWELDNAILQSNLLNSTHLQHALLNHETAVTSAEKKYCVVCAVSEAHWDWTEESYPLQMQYIHRKNNWSSVAVFSTKQIRLYVHPFAK